MAITEISHTAALLTYCQRQSVCLAVFAQTPWRTAANYSDLSDRWHITGSPVGKVLNGLWLRLDYIINVTHLVWVFTCRPKILSKKLAVTSTLLLTLLLTLNTNPNPKSNFIPSHSHNINNKFYFFTQNTSVLLQISLYDLHLHFIRNH